MYKKMQLKNGMKVLFVESHKSPVVSVQMWVKNGSADESAKERGVSHFIEHLLFKGTEKYKVGEIAKIVEASGGELNAYTSFDQTVFYVTISKEFLDTGLDVISQMMGSPSFDEDEINNEREVVVEEIKRGLDNPQRQASRLLFETVYKKHPYKYPVIGYEKIIRSIRPKQIIDYYHRRYVPSNMTLVVAGDVHSQKIKPKIKSYFGGFEDLPLKKVSRPKEEVQKRPRVKVEKSEFKENISYISWPVPAATHKDVPALDVLSVILGHGASSRLVKNLRVEQPLVNFIGASAYTPLDTGFFTVSFSTNSQNTKAAYNEVLKELSKLIEEGVSEEELIRAKVNFESDEFYSLETVDGLAKKVGHYDFLFNDHKYFNEYLRQVNKLTEADLTKVARKYLKPEKLNISVSATDSVNELKKFLNKWKLEYAKNYDLMRKKKNKNIKQKKIKKLKWSQPNASSGEPREVKLSSGSKVLLLPSTSTPVFNIKCASLCGLRAEASDQQGISEMLSRVWGSGTRNLNEKEIHNLIDDNASSLSAFSGRNSAGLSLTSLVPFKNEMLSLYFEVLTNPKFSEETLAREKIMVQEYLAKRDDNPVQRCVLQFMQLLFGDHPYAKDPYGSNETLKNIDTASIYKFKNTFVHQKNITFAVSGQFNEDKILQQIEEATKSLDKGKAFKQKFEFTPPQSNKKKKIKLNKEQSHIILGYPGLTFLDKDRYALEVIQSILAGQGGRLFVELRDKNSLAYSVSPLKMEGIDAGYFGAYIGCSPEKTSKAITMMKNEFDKLMHEKVSSHELESAKRYLIGRHDIGLQRTSAHTNNALFDSIYGVPMKETFAYSDKIHSVTSAKVQKVAKKIFSQSEIISVVGP
jgi:zinc protease